MPDSLTPPHKPKRRRLIKRVLLVTFAVALVYLCVFASAIHIVGLIDRTEDAEVIIVLGAGLRRDGRPGWALTRRAEMAADLWQQGIAPYILCTGAQADGYPRSEASACHELLIRNAVPDTAIWMEENSRSTEENASYSHQILVENGWSSVVLVSDSYHLLRAEWLFRAEGVRAYTSPVPASRINRPLSYPAAILREIVALHWYTLKEVFNIPVTHIYGL